MMYVILLFGLLIMVLGLTFLIRPQLPVDFTTGNAGTAWFHAVAVVSRLILGAALISYAPDSRYPMTFLVIGWLSIIAAVSFLVIGRSRFKAMVARALRFAEPWARLAGLVAVLLGAFFILSVI